MRYKDAIITVVGLLFSFSVLTGMANSEQFQRAAVAESGTFDALAHHLFKGSNAAVARPLPHGSTQ